MPLIVHILFLSGTINSTLRHCQIDAGTITTSDLNRTEQPWSYIVVGWDAFKAGGINQENIDLITETVQDLADYGEQQLRANLYAQPRRINPFSFLENILKQVSIVNAVMIDGVVTLITNYVFRGPLYEFLIKMPSNYGNSEGGMGLDTPDKARIVEALEDLHGINWESIDLFNNEYRYLSIDKDITSDNEFWTFSRVDFEGYNLKPTTRNSLGLRKIIYPDETASYLGLAPISAKSVENINPVTNTEELSEASFENNQLAISHSSNPHLVELLGWQNSILKIRSMMSESDITWESDSNLKRIFFHDVRGNYHFEEYSNAESDDRYLCEPFFHPDFGQYNAILDNESLGTPSDRVGMLLDMEEHQVAQRALTISRGSNFQFAEDSRRLSFLLTRPYGAYNWEIFFHIPLTVAVRLLQSKKFAEAQQWFHYIFNPLRPITLEGEAYDDAAAKYWHFLPLHRRGMPPEVTTGELETNAEEFTKDPFNPHRVARSRHGAYQNAVVMKYLDNLIAWGDHLFEQDTIESINEATQKYILAAKILGPRPKTVPKARELKSGTGLRPLGGTPPRTTEVLWDSKTKLIEFEHQWIKVNKTKERKEERRAKENEEMEKFVKEKEHPAVTEIITLLPQLLESVRCIPPNEKLLAYWDTVADRLFKIRHCRNIEGEVRDLPIFEPPIDPALLVRGKALGIEIADLLSDLYAPMPSYRFKVMLARALELCGDVQRLGGNLLSAIEKRDAEQLTLLRSEHERHVLKITRGQKERQIEESKENLKAAIQSLETVEARFEYYASRPFENQNEKAEVAKRNLAQGFNLASQIVALGASVAYAVPNIHQSAMGDVTFETGGQFFGNGLKGMSDFLRLIGDALSHEGTMHSIQGSRERRMDDWQFQAKQADSEISQQKRQILATEVRLAIAENDLELHRKQEENAEEIEDFLKAKFTNEQLYEWMVTQTSDIYFRSFKMAQELARKAEKCFRIECREETATYLGAGYWDNLKQGLLAGERLQADLRRMDADYDEYKGRYQTEELEKDVSLNLLAPMQLDLLRFEGRCRFRIPELLFDLDYPHHYQRRIKSVRVSIPTIIGPYTTVPCSLRLLSSRRRQEDGSWKPDPARPGNRNSATLSKAQNDTGMHNAAPLGEQYLPFELRGIDSEWEAWFPSDLLSFDRTTITDLILHIQYTALEGDTAGQAFDDRKDEIWTAYRDAVGLVEEDGMGQRIDIRREYPDLWSKFRQTGELSLRIEKKMFPYLAAPIITQVKGFSILAETSKDMGAGIELGTVPLARKRGPPQSEFIYDSGPTQKSVNLGQALDLSLDMAQFDPVTLLGPNDFNELVAVLLYEVSSA